jgi:hypothetical protein
VLFHTALGDGQPLDRTHSCAGGRELPDISNPKAVIISRNITSDPDQGISKWSDEQVKHAIVAGICPDGTRLSARCRSTGMPN